MLALLRLDAAVLSRNWRSLLWTAFLIGTPIAFMFVAEQERDLADPGEAAAWFAGMTSMAALFGWFAILAQAEGLIAVAPVATATRALHHVALGGVLAVPTAACAAWTSGPETGLVAGLLLLTGIVLFATVCVLMLRWPSWIRLVAVALLFFGPPFAVGAHVALGALPYSLPVCLLATALFVLLYVKGVARRLEMSGGWALQLLESAPRPRLRPKPGTPPALSVLEGGRTPSAPWILFKTVYLRWYSLAFALLLLAMGFMPDSGFTTCMFAMFAMMWPLSVWAGFQASPLPRTTAFLALVGPLFLLWIASFAIGAATSITRHDVDFITTADGAVVLGIAQRRNAWTDDPSKQPAPLPDDPSTAAERIRGYLHEVFGLRTAPAEVLSLRSTGTDADSWARAIDGRYRPEIRRIASWLSILTALGRLAVVALLAGLYFMSRNHRAGFFVLLASVMLGVYLQPLFREGGRWEALGDAARDFAVAAPIPLALGLALLCSGLFLWHFVSFHRYEPSNAAWRSASGSRPA